MFLSKSFGRKTCRCRIRSQRLFVEALEERTVLSFITAASYVAGPYPVSVAVGDFNGDGKQDLAVVDRPYGAIGTVSILLGNGDGTFQTPQSYAVGPNPTSVAVGDFNGDGTLDLAVSNAGTSPDYGDGSVSILLGKGDGTFQAAHTYPVGANPSSVAVGDFNGDGHLDLVVTNSGTYFNPRSTVSVLLGNGDGSFQGAQTYAAGSNPTFVAVGDFNNDGTLDLAVADAGNPPDYTDGSVSILLGQGDGSFQAGQTYAVGSYPVGMTVGDFNADGHLDLAVVGHSWLRILLGQGDGTFQVAQSYSVDYDPHSVAAGDFNGDGHLDLAVAGNFRPGTVGVLLGKGDGTFQAPQLYLADSGIHGSASFALSVAIGQFTGGGHLDLAVANSGSGSVGILLGNGNGSFHAAPIYATDQFPGSIVVADMNGDGIPDLAVASFLSGVNVLLGNADGTFQPARNYAAGSHPRYLEVADLNGDGNLDLVVANLNDSVSVLLGNGDGTFQAPQSYTFTQDVRSLAVGDFNGDGIPDLAVSGFGVVSILLGNGDGSFQAAREYPAEGGSLEVADFNGDGKLDIVTSGGSLLLGNGDGTFQQPSRFGAPGYSVAVGDFNGDGIPDLAVGNVDLQHDGQGTVSIFLGNGDGTFRAGQTYTFGNNRASALEVADFDRDGIPDLAVANYGDDKVSILLGNGDGTFQAPLRYTVGDTPTNALAVGDFNRNGYADLVVGFGLDKIIVLVNAADWGGHHAAAPPQRLPFHRPVPSRPQRELVFALVASSPPQPLLQYLVAPSDLQPHLVQPWAQEIRHGQPAYGEATKTPRFLWRAGHPPNSLFEEWADPVADVLARNLLR